jgi:hypothetical protein
MSDVIYPFLLAYASQLFIVLLFLMIAPENFKSKKICLLSFIPFMPLIMICVKNFKTIGK